MAEQQPQPQQPKDIQETPAPSDKETKDRLASRSRRAAQSSQEPPDLPPPAHPIYQNKPDRAAVEAHFSRSSEGAAPLRELILQAAEKGVEMTDPSPEQYQALQFLQDALYTFDRAIKRSARRAGR
jgi:hypothetical protein